jgi:hypothetical protein
VECWWGQFNPLAWQTAKRPSSTCEKDSLQPRSGCAACKLEFDLGHSGSRSGESLAVSNAPRTMAYTLANLNFILNACPGSCTIALCGILSLPKIAEIPTIPSGPITPTSMLRPSSVNEIRDAMPVLMKCTCEIFCPDSYRDFPTGHCSSCKKGKINGKHRLGECHTHHTHDSLPRSTMAPLPDNREIIDT